MEASIWYSPQSKSIRKQGLRVCTIWALRYRYALIFCNIYFVGPCFRITSCLGQVQYSAVQIRRSDWSSWDDSLYCADLLWQANLAFLSRNLKQCFSRSWRYPRKETTTSMAENFLLNLSYLCNDSGKVVSYYLSYLAPRHFFFFFSSVVSLCFDLLVMFS